MACGCVPDGEGGHTGHKGKGLTEHRGCKCVLSKVVMQCRDGKGQRKRRSLWNFSAKRVCGRVLPAILATAGGQSHLRCTMHERGCV